MTQRKVVTLSLAGIAILLVSSILSFNAVRYLFNPSSSQNTSDQQGDQVKPVDAQAFCPLNGKQFTQREQLEWEKRRPVAVMIENHPEARPQSGLSAADVVYEVVAEGGITRFMAMYLCEPTPQIVGPVRSARTYYLDWLSEYDALYAHVGGANTPGPADALGQLKTYGLKDIDQMGPGIKAGYYRDENRLGAVALEHTMYLDIAKLREYAQSMFNWGVSINGARWDSTFEKWKFLEAKPGASSQMPQLENPVASSAATINYAFWPNFDQFGVSWTYDQVSNQYKRTMGGNPHLDKNNNEQISVSNVILMTMEESRANDGYPGNVHLLYQTVGTGDAYFFINGQMIKGTWSKSGRTARTKFYDSAGKEIVLQRGKIWLSIVPTYSEETITVN